MHRSNTNPHSNPAILLDHVTLRRGEGRIILDDISWDVPRGSCSAVLGPNGAGKSTLLAVISGYMWPSEGRVRVLGETYGRTDIRALRRRIGVLSHSRMPECHSEMTVFDTVLAGRFGGYILPPTYNPGKADRAEVSRILGIVGIAARAEETFGTLSSGEMARVALARALVAEPDLLILDEPTAALDMGGRAAFIDALDSLKRSRPNLTIVMVTHYVESLPSSVQAVLLLREGKIIASGPVKKTLTSGNLSAAFGCRVELFSDDGRFWTRTHPAPMKFSA